jgi:prevent-host-death family protein
MKPKAKNVWQVQEAKARLSAVIEKAAKSGPQVITKHGAECAAVISIEDLKTLRKAKDKKPNFVDYLLSGPKFDDADLVDEIFKRNPEVGRMIDFTGPEFGPNEQDDCFARIFALSGAIRYVSLYRGGLLFTQQRDALDSASAPESDRYEELFVNPTLLTLARQRGNLDCGGAEFVLVRYGNFYQLVIDLPDGHASVCFEPNSNPLEFARAIRGLCRETIVGG